MKSISMLSLLFFMLGIAAPAFGNPGDLETCDRLEADKKFSESRDFLEKALSDTDSREEKSVICWRLSRVTLIITDDGKKNQPDTEVLLRGYEQGAAWAEKAIGFDSQSPEAYFWRASNYGSWAQVKGGLDALGKVNAARDDLITALRLKPDFTAAFYVLGLLYTSLPGWPISFGNIEFGISLLRRAIDMADKPENALGHYLNLAMALWGRNWDVRTRNDKRQAMAQQFKQKREPAEKYSYYEGALDFSQGIFPGGKPLAAFSDREEARALLEYVETRGALLVKKPEDAALLKQAVQKVRERLR